MNKLEVIGRELLPVIAYGDAAGLPYENKKSYEIPMVTKLNNTLSNPYIGEYLPGTWSDDTHLSIVVAKSLINCGGFDLDNQAKEHVDALMHVEGATFNADLIPPIVTTSAQNGWGKSTTFAIKRLIEGHSPLKSGQPDGGGNGVLMKLAPLLYWQYVRKTDKNQCAKEVKDLTIMTNAGADAQVASLVHFAVMHGILNSNAQPKYFVNKAFFEQTAELAEQYETQLSANNVLSTKLRSLGRACIGGRISVDAIAEVSPRGGFYAPETLAMVYANMANYTNFPESVFRVISLGGDTDSTASITASMALFLNADINKPADYKDTFDFDRLQRISNALAKAALKY